MKELLGRSTRFGSATCRVILACLCLVSNVAAGAQGQGKQQKEEGDLCPGAVTQAEFNDCGARMYKKEDDELNRVYQEILKRNKDDSVFIRKFREAQRAWIKFRDAQFDAMFPKVLDRRGQYTALYNYGSVFPMCAGTYKASLTHARVEELRLWLDGTDEGDVCSGSLPIKEETP